MRKPSLTTALLGLTAAAAATVVALTAADAQPATKPPPANCFSSTDWSGWKATKDSKAIYIRVRVNDLYRLDLSGSCPTLQWPNARLITKLRGGSWICSPLDMELKVSDGAGTAMPCIVSKITPLSREDAAALPRHLRP
jgi:hypothetical protein